jgi:hypothetical protein
MLGKRIAVDGKAVAVAVGPCGTDGCPVGGFAFAVDAVDSVGWLAVRKFRLLGHDLLLFLSARPSRSFVRSKGDGAIKPLVRPRPSAPKGMVLHKPKARKRMGLTGGGHVQKSSTKEAMTVSR